jgi:hypothetical protein
VSDVPGPRIYVIHNLVTKEEAEHLKSLGLLKGMEKALIIPYGGKQLIESSTRTNTAAWLDFQQDPVVTKVERAYAEITGLPAENGENLQVTQPPHPSTRRRPSIWPRKRAPNPIRRGSPPPSNDASKPRSPKFSWGAHHESSPRRPSRCGRPAPPLPQILRYQSTQQFHEHHDYFDPAEDPPENFEPGGAPRARTAPLASRPARTDPRARLHRGAARAIHHHGAARAILQC